MEATKEEKFIALNKAGKMAKIYGILLFGSIGLSLLFQILSIALYSSPITGIISVIFGSAFTIAFGLFLIFFGNHTQKYFSTNDEFHIEKGLYNLRWYFSLQGVLLIILFSLVLIGLTFSILISVLQ